MTRSGETEPTASDATPPELVVAVDAPENPDDLAAEAAADSEGTVDAPWRRLSWRMLFVDPLGTLVRLAPIFLFSLWIGSERTNYWFEGIILGLIVSAAVLRWVSTSFRIGPTHIVLKKGYFNRQVITVARERIRSVDTESDLFHRVMQVTIVEIGTSTQDAGKSQAERFRLDAIATCEVEPLRDELLSHLRRSNPNLDPEDEEQWGSRYGEDIARWKVTWSRYAPFSVIGFGVLFSLWLITWQMGDLHDKIRELTVFRTVVDHLDELGTPWSFLGKCVAVWCVAGVLSVFAYAIRYGRYALTDHGSVLYVQNGVLRRKHQALDKSRLRGVDIRLPVYLRLLGGGRLDPIMTGTKSAGGARGSTLLPQAPMADVRRVAARILDDEAPLTVPLRRHGFTAARRRITRGLFPFYAVAASGLLLRWDRGPSVDPWLVVLLPAAFVLFVFLAIDRIRMLGHALLPGRLVLSSGSWAARRVVLDADGIIGWSWSQSPFQRWAGVANVGAATPAGAGGYMIQDMPASEVWALAESITPGITDQWGTVLPSSAPSGSLEVSDSATAGHSPLRAPAQEHPPQRDEHPGDEQTQAP